MTKDMTKVLEAQKRKPGRPSIYLNAREEIANAALKLFAQRGFEATSIGEIAVQAGVPKTNVIYYFNSKEELWRYVVDAQWAEIERFYAERLPVTYEKNKATIELVIRVFLEACIKFPAYTSIPILEGNANTWRAEWLAENHLGPHIAMSHNFHQNMVAAGVLKTNDPLVFQMIMGGFGHLFFGQAQLWKSAEGSGNTNEQYIERFVQGLLALICH
jgi:TetR/AcrR family transcriptional regulator